MQEAKKSVMFSNPTPHKLEWSEGKWKKLKMLKTNLKKGISIVFHGVIYPRPVIYTDELTCNKLIYFHILVKERLC